jgi:hypothetical protein
MKQSIARVCLTVAVVFFFLGFFMLCYCPGWYAIAAALAGVAAWREKGRIRAWGFVLLVASLFIVGLDIYGEAKEHRRHADLLERIKQQRTQQTNAVDRPKLPQN